MGFIRKIIKRLRGLKIRYRINYGRVWLQSALFSLPPKGGFPPAWLAVKQPWGWLAIGGELTPETLLEAYAKGIYPFYDTPPVRWFSCHPRMVLFLEKTKLEKKTRRIIRSGHFRVTFDTAFEDVIHKCSERAWTWLISERIDVAIELHKRGRAHSVEVWNADGALVGGVVGVDMGRGFISETCFHEESNAGKVADAYLHCHLQHWGYAWCDAQAYNPHLAAQGYEQIPRRKYIRGLRELAGADICCSKWAVDEHLDVGHWDPSLPGSQVRGQAKGT